MEKAQIRMKNPQRVLAWGKKKKKGYRGKEGGKKKREGESLHARDDELHRDLKMVEGINDGKSRKNQGR